MSQVLDNTKQRADANASSVYVNKRSEASRLLPDWVCGELLAVEMQPSRLLSTHFAFSH